MTPSLPRTQLLLIGLAAATLLGGLGYALWYGHETAALLEDARSELASTTAAYQEAQARIAAAAEQQAELAEDLGSAVQRNQESSMQIASLASAVETLDKLAKTDKQLLAKYSKVYFLNENYLPAELAAVDPDDVYEKGRKLELHAGVEPYLEKLIDAAEDDDVTLKVLSAYRSFGTQAELKASYRLTYGIGANRFSAEQGYSEHQLGTTVDFTTPASGASFNGFDKSDGYAWLTENAWRYGFVISYPKENSYYQYEPWHWRFVGKALAKRLHEDEEYFYDLDQREIDEYLVSLFD